MRTIYSYILYVNSKIVMKNLNKYLLFFLSLYQLYLSLKYTKMNKTYLSGFHKISFSSNKKNFLILKNNLILSKHFTLFNIIPLKTKFYLLEYRNVYLLGIDKNDNLTIYLKNKNKNCEKCIWNLILIKYLFFT